MSTLEPIAMPENVTTDMEQTTEVEPPRRRNVNSAMPASSRNQFAAIREIASISSAAES